MLGRLPRIVLVIPLVTSLGSCAGYVDEFSPRVNNGDEAYNRSIANGVVNNLIRAGYNEPTSFVGLGKYTGTNNTTLNGAIPGFTLSKDPLQIAVTGFSGKEDTNAQIEATVLNTRKFVRGMFTPIDLSTFKYFIDQNYPRELLLYLFVDQFRITNTATGLTEVLRNDPSLDVSPSCHPHDYTDYANRMATTKEPPAEYGPFTEKRECEFHRFQYWVEEAMRYGFNIDQVDPPAPTPPKPDPAPKAAAPASDDKKKADPPAPVARICYDLGLMSGDTAKNLLAEDDNRAFAKENVANTPICKSKPPSGSTDAGLTLAKALPFIAGGRKITLRVSLELRSPAAMYRYVGRMLLNRSYEATELFERSAITPNDRQLLAIDQGRTEGCYAVTVHYGVPFCVPREAFNTKAVIAILASLVQLNTDRDDLPTNTTTVNISP